MKRLVSAGCILMVLLFSTVSFGAVGIDELDSLPPGEQYRQLSLILMISGGTDPELLDALSSVYDNTQASAGFKPDDYKTPLIRIVDQESMLSGAAYLLRYASDSHDDIKAGLERISGNNPVLISMVDLNAITEDAIIIRNAIADSIGYSALAEDETLMAHLENYRIHTIRIRNVMEYELFNKELALLTEEAIDSVGGKLEAYQRMFDEEVDSKEFNRQFDAAQYIYNRTERFDEEAGILTEEIMKSVILSQSKPNP